MGLVGLLAYAVLAPVLGPAVELVPGVGVEVVALVVPGRDGVVERLLVQLVALVVEAGRAARRRPRRLSELRLRLALAYPDHRRVVRLSRPLLRSEKCALVGASRESHAAQWAETTFFVQNSLQTTVFHRLKHTINKIQGKRI